MWWISWLVIIGAAIFFGLVYSVTEIDPDWSMFNLKRFTGATYGKDFADCKTPAIHLWYYLIGLAVGKSIPRIRFVHHVLVSLPGLVIFYQTGSLFAALAFVLLVNNGRLLAFHGNVSQQPAGAIAIALVVDDPWLKVILLAIALFFEPKLLPSVAVMVSMLGVKYAALPVIAAAALGGSLYLLSRQWWDWLVELNITIPMRMAKHRQSVAEIFPVFTANALAEIVPWVIFAVIAKPDIVYWLPAILYIIVLIPGRYIRGNHMLVLAPWIALAGIPDSVFIALALAHMAGAGLYLGNLWGRFYPGLDPLNKEAAEIGKWIKNLSGDLWVNGIMTNIYIYAEKPPVHGMAEQAEIASVATERREKWKERWARFPPAYVVMSHSPVVRFKQSGYRLVATGSYISQVFRRH